MMRHVALIVVSALALVACNPSAQNGASNGDGTTAANGGGIAFPNLLASSYRAEGTLSGHNGESIPLVMMRSGGKTRMEMNRPEGQMVIISNTETHEGFSIMHQGGRVMAMRMDLSNVPQASDPVAMWQANAGATTPGGPCAQAGQTGNIFNTVRDGEQNSVCVTGDGIILWAKHGEETVMNITSVQRGPQDGAQFTLPPGVQVMDLGDIGARAAAAAAAAKGAQNGH